MLHCILYINIPTYNKSFLKYVKMTRRTKQNSNHSNYGMNVWHTTLQNILIAVKKHENLTQTAIKKLINLFRLSYPRQPFIHDWIANMKDDSLYAFIFLIC